MFSAWRASRELQIQLSDFRDAVDAASDFRAELLLNFVDGDARVFDHIVQKAGLKRNHIHLHLGENQRHVRPGEHMYGSPESRVWPLWCSAAKS